jgi:hypothetical protein
MEDEEQQTDSCVGCGNEEGEGNGFNDQACRAEDEEGCCLRCENTSIHSCVLAIERNSSAELSCLLYHLVYTTMATRCVNKLGLRISLTRA